MSTLFRPPGFAEIGEITPVPECDPKPDSFVIIYVERIGVGLPLL